LEDNSPAMAHLQFLYAIRNAQKLKPGQLEKAGNYTPTIPCPAFDGSDKSWYVELYSSALLLQKKINDNFGTKNAKQSFDSTLHQQVSFNVGVQVVKSLDGNLLLKTGLQYNRINEAFRLSRINERRLVTTISVRMVVLRPGDTIYIRDTSVTERFGSIQVGRQNSYTQWDVPIILGYRFASSALEINANAGFILNIRSSYRGLVLDTAQQVKDINDVGGKALFRRNVGLSFYAGLSLLKPISSRINLLVEPHARFGISNTAAESAWFRQKNNLYGVSVGLRYQLSGGRQRN
jgi:hypothetical protein